VIKVSEIAKVIFFGFQFLEVLRGSEHVFNKSSEEWPIKGLGDVLGSARLKTKVDGLLIVSTCNNEYWKICGIITRSQTPTGFNAADTWHIDIHKDKVRGVVGDELQRLVAVFGLENAHAFRFEALPNQQALHTVVIADQY
jgi:hypothetical protein